MKGYRLVPCLWLHPSLPRYLSTPTATHTPHLVLNYLSLSLPLSSSSSPLFSSLSIFCSLCKHNLIICLHLMQNSFSLYLLLTHFITQFFYWIIYTLSMSSLISLSLPLFFHSLLSCYLSSLFPSILSYPPCLHHPLKRCWSPRHLITTSGSHYVLLPPPTPLLSSIPPPFSTNSFLFHLHSSSSNDKNSLVARVP